MVTFIMEKIKFRRLQLSGQSSKKKISLEFLFLHVLVLGEFSSDSVIITSGTLSPLDSSVAVALSTTTLAFYRVMDTEMRAMPQPQVSLAEGSELSCHCWLRQPEDHCVAGTSQGELILYRSGDFVCFLALMGSFTLSLVAFAVLGLLGFIVADSIHVFAERASVCLNYLVTWPSRERFITLLLP